MICTRMALPRRSLAERRACSDTAGCHGPLLAASSGDGLHRLVGAK